MFYISYLFCLYFPSINVDNSESAYTELPSPQSTPNTCQKCLSYTRRKWFENLLALFHSPKVFIYEKVDHNGIHELKLLLPHTCLTITQNYLVSCIFCRLHTLWNLVMIVSLSAYLPANRRRILPSMS